MSEWRMEKLQVIYEERLPNYMRKCATIYEEAISDICNCSILNFLIHEENLIFFLSVHWDNV
jgi:hypothetical protein